MYTKEINTLNSKLTRGMLNLTGHNVSGNVGDFIRDRKAIRSFNELGKKTGGLTGYIDHVKKMPPLTKVLTGGGYLMTGLDVVEGGGNIIEACTAAGGKNCKHVSAVEISKFGGAMAGGAVGGRVGNLVGAGAIYLLVTGGVIASGGTLAIVIAGVAVVGGTVGGAYFLGDYLGEQSSKLVPYRSVLE